MDEDAMECVTEVVGVHRATAEQATEKVRDPLPAALLVGKATVTAEPGVALRVAPGTLLLDRLVDPCGLVTIVGNLVDNVLDAAAGTDGARAEVGLHTEGRTVVPRVHDSRPGVPAAQRALIFTEGWSTKELPAHGRRGLGLALVRRLAERQRDGRRGGGRRHRVHRRTAGGPRRSGHDGPGIDRTGSYRTEHRHRGRKSLIEVLVVDDDIRVAKVNAAYVFRVPGFRVTALAHSAAEALTTIEEQHVDLVLLDHYMPRRSGLSMVRELRRLGHRTDVITWTAARDVATVRDAMGHGALQYLVKPSPCAGLRTKLEAHAALRHTLERSGKAEQGVKQTGSSMPSGRWATPICPRDTHRPRQNWSAERSAAPKGRSPRRRSRRAPG